MPEYLAPGVYVEETSVRGKTIQGVGTSTAAFVGPCRFGPTRGEPPLLTSYAEFEQVYGGLEKLHFDRQDTIHNYVAQAVRAFFKEGGQKLYVARTYLPADGKDGIARWDSSQSLPGESPPNCLQLRARYPGAAGEFAVTFTVNLGQNLLQTDSQGNLKPGIASPGDVVWVQPKTEPGSAPTTPGRLYEIENHKGRLRLGKSSDVGIAGIAAPGSLEKAQLVSLTVKISGMGYSDGEQVWDDLAFDPAHPNSIANVFAEKPARRTRAPSAPVIFESDCETGVEIAHALTQMGNIDDGTAIVLNLDSNRMSARSTRLQLSGGNDGQRPSLTEYRGSQSGNGASGLKALEALADISIVAAPGSTHDFTQKERKTAYAESIMREVISHCEHTRYRVAVLDSIEGSTPNEVLNLRRTIDSSRAALYFPWVRLLDPLSNEEFFNPPSGHICGIYARTDTEKGVHKAPANAVIRLATGSEIKVTRRQQELLNPAGINCLRFFRGRGFRVWGARTISSDSEWKYVNVRRYFNYLERSIEVGTQWAVFEENGESLWINIRGVVEDFLYNEWRAGHIPGARQEEAFFVRCDRTTMTQADLDQGRMICLVGVAPLKPAEFVMFRIGQKTSAGAP